MMNFNPSFNNINPSQFSGGTGMGMGNRSPIFNDSFYASSPGMGSHLPGNMNNPYMQAAPGTRELGLPGELGGLYAAGMGRMGDALTAANRLGIHVDAPRFGGNPLVQNTMFTPMAGNIIAGILGAAAPHDPQGVLQVLQLTSGDQSLLQNMAYRSVYESIRGMYSQAGIFV